MIKKTSSWALLFIFLYALSSVSLADGRDRHRHHDGHDHGSHGQQHGNDYQGQQRILVKLLGWSQAYKPGSGEGMLEYVPDVDDDVVCQDVDMVDLQSNEVIATSTDCFSSIEPDSGGGAGFTGTSYLNFPDGTLIAQGGFTAQPVLREATNIEGVTITAVTGAAKEGNAIIGGTGKYEHVTGNVRVSGLINGEGYAFMPGDTMYFDCIFEIQLFD